MQQVKRKTSQPCCHKLRQRMLNKKLSKHHLSH
jgi:hypothetical protein